MRALVKASAAPGAELQTVPVPTIGPRDVLVKVHTASICGTDLHIYQWDAWSQSRIVPPLVFGHEFCGHVAELGSEAAGFAPGDFVSADMHVFCGHCYQCRSGEAHICQSVKILGVDAPGCFAEYVRIPAANLVKLDAGISTDYGAILDPLGNAVHTVLAGPVAGRSVAIVGCGPIGLMAVAVARACGGGPVFAIEINEFRRNLARALQADFVLDPRTDDVAGIIQKHTQGGGVDASLEFSGHPDGIHSAFKIARPGGRVSLLGIPSRPVEVDLTADIIFKGLNVQGINGRRLFDTWHQMIALLGQKRLPLDPLFTDRLPLADFQIGMERLQRGVAAKVLLTP
ncbi:MAG TPA: L-threonine 3-dehydrogenase [Terriglobales bacterium]|nr:L-threonine 3-dehydrogenase [Terriglobales bacterium]